MNEKVNNEKVEKIGGGEDKVKVRGEGEQRTDKNSSVQPPTSHLQPVLQPSTFNLQPHLKAKGIAGILGNPDGFVRKLCAEKAYGREGVPLVLLAAGGAAMFGFGAGCFVDLSVALFDALKAGGIVLFSYLICLPTLYVFASLGGCRTPFARLAFVGLVPLAALGCVLAALAPVLWLFAVSTESLAFFTILTFAMVLVGLCLSARLIGSFRRAGVVTHQQGVSAWFVVFIVVALQAITLVRPMLAPIDAERTPAGKCFFLQHFGKSMMVRPMLAPIDAERTPVGKCFFLQHFGKSMMGD